jgi:phosphoribosylamine--glycine ligase
MQRHAVPTARYGEFTDRDAAIRHIETCGYDVVVKADGLAAGKGVVVPDTPEQAISAVRMMMDEGAFGGAGARVVLEEKLTGEEATLLCFCDGRTLLPMVPSQDHKRVNDDDKGPNTGGMGVYAPAPLITPELMEKIKHKVLEPTLKGLIEDQLDYRGVLYVGLMIVDGEPYVIEYNARFGDPETEVVLPLMETDLVDVLEAVEAQTLERLALSWKTGAAVSVVLASGGYPGKYETGHHIRGLDQTGDALVFHAGTAEKGGKVVTAGGRVLAVTALGDTLQQAIDYAYLAVDKIDFQDKHYRTDIGKKGLKATDT